MVPASQRRRTTPRLLLACCAVALCAGTVARPLAQSSPPQSGVYELVARHSGKCLDVYGGSADDAAQIIQWSCHGEPNQRWRLQPTDSGYVRLIATHSNKALDVNGASPDNEAPIIQYTPNGGLNQQWRLQLATDGHYVLVARHSGKALDVPGSTLDDGAALIQWTVHGAANQQWLLRPVALDPPDEGELSTADIVRFLEQATFGPTPDLIKHVRQVGLEGFLEEQFAEPMSSYPSMPLFPSAIDTATCTGNCPRDNYTMYPLQNRFFVNALYGSDQLRQRVAFALHQIIVVSGVDISLPSWMTPYLQTLDRHAFGNYRELLFDITLNPAMGNYLDVNGNTRTNPNENYAREVLQLFSIGTVRLNPDGTPQLDGAGQTIPTYDQDDVNAFARVFTGWRFATAPATGVPNYIDPMVALQSAHDIGVKTLLNGEVLPLGQTALADLNGALDNIFEDPNVGPFVSKALIQHLVTSNPSPGYVSRVTAVFNNSAGVRGDLKAVVRAILLDPEARGDSKPDANYGRLRHPAQFIAGLLRALGAQSADGTALSDGYLNPQAVFMGMDVFRPPSVFSYFSPGTVVPGSTTGVRGPEFGLFSTSTALRRIEFVRTMVFLTGIAVGTNSPLGTSLNFTPLLPLASDPGALVDELDTLLLHDSMSNEMRQSIVTAVSAVASTNALKRVRTAVYLVATSSQYQVER